MSMEQIAERRGWGDYVLAAGIALVAAAVSPPGIALMVGRPDLSVRVTVFSLALVIFLLTIVGAVLARGRLRSFFFYLIIWTSPLPLLAVAEAAAIAVHLADRIAPIENLAMLKSWHRWPPYLLSEARWSQPLPDGVRLYKPWSGNGVRINSTGLRTAEPQPKAAGEWRIAITGASTVYGWRVLDADTLPVRLQEALRGKHPNVTVYNFGIEGVTMARELALLKHLHERYEIDEVVFYTGGIDLIDSYIGAMSSSEAARRIRANLSTFELVRAASRLVATTTGPSTDALAYLDQEVLPQIIKRNPLREGIHAADAYCRAASLRCQAMFHPTLFGRRSPHGPEVTIALNAERVYPRMGALGAKMYRDVLDHPPQMPVSDLSGIFDPSDRPFYVDPQHVNEEGNAYLAERLAARLSARLP
jgi:hypothetical protein